MGLLDGILNQVSDHPDVANLAAKVGIDEETAEKAIAALGVSHQEQGDTIAGAAAKTGLDNQTLTQIVQQIGGEGSLTEFSRMLHEHPQISGLLSQFNPGGGGK